MEIDVATLARMRQNGEPHTVLDVREPWERAICALQDSLHIPMRELPGRIDELPREETVVVLCHHGFRSQQVTNWLRQKGYGNAMNLSAGIDAWARQIDPSMASY